MNTLVTQAVAVKGHDPVIVTAETTACPYLVITPTVTRDKDGAVRLLGGLRLTHTKSGYAVTGGEVNGERLQDLARRLADLNWDFTDPADVDQRGGQIIREWRMATVDTSREVRFPGDDDDLVAARQQDPAGTFLREQLDWWMKHQKALHNKAESGKPTFDENPQAYSAEINASCMGFGLVYLLAVLRTVDPQVADVAATWLNIQYECGDALGEWAWQWNNEHTAAQPLTLRGIPTPDPLADFGQ